MRRFGMAESELGLADAIDVVRSELRKAQDKGWASDVRFSVGSVEVELAVEIVKVRGAEASVKVLSVLSVGGKGQASRGETNRVKVVLNPIGVGGEPFEVASLQGHRPDASDEGSGGADVPDASASGTTGLVVGRPGG